MKNPWNLRVFPLNSVWWGDIHSTLTMCLFAPDIGRKDKEKWIYNGNCTTRDFKMRARSIWNHKYDFRPKLHARSSITTLIHPFWNHSFLKNLYWSTRLVCKKGNRKRVYMYMSIKQSDTCHLTKTHWSAKEIRVNFIHANVQAALKSCYCKNSLLQSEILVVWLNNISPSLLLRLWLRHRVLLGEKIVSTAGIILRRSFHAVLEL